MNDFGVQFKADSITGLESEIEKIFEKEGIK